jgi:hypothetical protein
MSPLRCNHYRQRPNPSQLKSLCIDAYGFDGKISYRARLQAELHRGARCCP